MPSRWTLSNGNNSILWIPEINVYDVMAKCTALEQSNEDFSMPVRKNHSKERTARTPAVIERAQALMIQSNRCAF